MYVVSLWIRILGTRLTQSKNRRIPIPVPRRSNAAQDGWRGISAANARREPDQVWRAAERNPSRRRLHIEEGTCFCSLLTHDSCGGCISVREVFSTHHDNVHVCLGRFVSGSMCVPHCSFSSFSFIFLPLAAIHLWAVIDSGALNSNWLQGGFGSTISNILMRAVLAASFFQFEVVDFERPFLWKFRKWLPTFPFRGT